MDKQEYLIKAIQAQCYTRKEWMINAFSLTASDPEQYLTDPYPYRLVQSVTGFYYVDPTLATVGLTKISDAKPNTQLFHFKDSITVTKDIYPTISAPIESVLGNLLVNLICIHSVFGSKVSYVNKPFSIKSIEREIAAKLVDAPTDAQAPRDPAVIYVDEYIKFVDSLTYLKGWSQLCVQGATYTTWTPPPGIKKYKAELLAKYAGRLNDPNVLAEIDKALIAYDANYLKGDPGGELYAGSKKSREVVRKKLFLTLGAEEGIVVSNKADTSVNSLEEGWEIKNLPTLNNSLRAGSFNRGSQTQLGGLLTKQLLRATANLTINSVDCGTKAGILRYVSESDYNRLVGITIVVNGQNVYIKDAEQAKSYVGKSILKRSPMYCKSSKTDFCKGCIGDLLSRNPQGLSLALADYGSAILLLFLAKMHGSSLVLVKLDKDSFLS